MTNAVAIVFAGMVISIAIAFAGHYQVAATSVSPKYATFWRVNTWTGEVLYCDAGETGIGCSAAQMKP